MLRAGVGPTAATGRSGATSWSVHVGPTATQIAVLEGRTLIEHYVSRPADDATQIDGNIYLGRVQNVLPGMEAAFVDIGTPKNAVLYRGDLRYDDDEVERPAYDDGGKPTRGRLGGAASDARIEQLLRTGQSIICQVTKNPIGTKGARLTQEVSLPGRFVVLIPDSDTYGISKRLGDDERRRLRKILDDIRPAGHGLIVRTAAEGASAEELGRDVGRLLRQWEPSSSWPRRQGRPSCSTANPTWPSGSSGRSSTATTGASSSTTANLYDEVKEYVTSITPELADRVELVDPDEEPLPLFERFRVHEQVHKALDRKVWLPSGGSIIIERTEALTVIDVNTGKNVGTSNLEETVFRNNLEAAEEISRQLRLRDIGGIIVIDFIDMEVMANRAEVIRTFREALARDKTRSQVFDISELGLVEMTRKRISEGLVESYSETCPTCGGRGHRLRRVAALTRRPGRGLPDPVLLDLVKGGQGGPGDRVEGQVEAEDGGGARRLNIQVRRVQGVDGENVTVEPVPLGWGGPHVAGGPGVIARAGRLRLVGRSRRRRRPPRGVP